MMAKKPDEIEVEPAPPLISDSEREADAERAKQGLPPKYRKTWNWQPIETAPIGQLCLIAICKGELRCPVRSDRYVAMAMLRPDGHWVLFGQGEVREDERVTHWIVPELPEEYPQDVATDAHEHMDIWQFTGVPVNEREKQEAEMRARHARAQQKTVYDK
jgi:hypothetical protein